MRPFIWNADLSAIVELDERIKRQLGTCPQNRFFGFALGQLGIGVWWRKPSPFTKTETGT